MDERDDVHGDVDPAFAGVREAFAANFAVRGELGAAVAVYHRGVKVVDLWGGVRDRRTRAPFMADTAVRVFSTGKGLAALTLARAVALGRLAFGDRVADHWPAFAANGKAAITVADVLDHRAGLVLFGRPVTRHDLADPERMAAIAEAMRPVWPPGEAWGYHMTTHGVLVGEIVRRTDPAGRTLARVFEEDIAGPLGADARFGLPPSFPDERLARLSLATPSHVAWGLARAPAGLIRQAFDPFSLLVRSAREVRDFSLNDRSFLAPEFASANAVATARGVARIYAALADGGGELGLTPEVFAALVAPPVVPPSGDRDRVMGIRGAWRLGFARPSADFPYARSPRALGMPGLGGSFGFADPDRRIGYAYAPNRLGLMPFDDRRDRALREALDRCLAAL